MRSLPSSLLINSISIMQEPTAVDIILEYILEVRRLCSLGLPVTEDDSRTLLRNFPWRTMMM